MEKVIRDGNVAVLISPNYGAGWSTWNTEYAETLLFHPKLVELAEANNTTESEVQRFCEKELGLSIYAGGWGDIKVEWVPEGTKFIVNEYDGYESIQFSKQTEWIIA